jgi:hypothetical protein
MATKTMTKAVPANETAKYEAAFAEYLERIDRVLERNKRTQARIDKLKTETAAIRVRTQARIKSLCGKSF